MRQLVGKSPHHVDRVAPGCIAYLPNVMLSPNESKTPKNSNEENRTS